MELFKAWGYGWVKQQGGSLPAPTFVSVSPAWGPTDVPVSITITGTGFVSGATVTVGGTAATSVVFNSATSITCTTPTHAAGAVNIVVTNPDTQTATGTGAFLYLASTALWLDANVGVTQASNLVSAWVSRDVNAYSFVLFAAGKEPTYTANSYGSLPAITFNGTSGQLKSSGNVNPVGGAASFSMYAIFKALAGGPNFGSVLNDQDGSNSKFIIQKNNGTSTSYYSYTYDGTLEGQTVGTVSNTALQNFTTVRNSNVSQLLYVNGALADTDNSTGSVTPNGTILGIGGQGGTQGGQLFKGDIVEIIIFGAAHSAATQAILEAYLQTKWGF